jgi:hypothetical protein
MNLQSNLGKVLNMAGFFGDISLILILFLVKVFGESYSTLQLGAATKFYLFLF